MLKQLSLAVLIVSAATTAHAQFGFGSGSQRINRPLNRPTVSPYVNLLRSGGGGGVGLNYYGLVRPEQQFGASIQQLQGGLGSAGFARGGRGGAFIGGGGMRTTGHAVVFDSYRSNAAFGGGLGGGGFLSQGAGGSFGGFGFGSAGSSFSPLNNGALTGSGISAVSGGGGGGAGGPVSGGGVAAGAGGGADFGGGQGGQVAGPSGSQVPWGPGSPIGSSGGIIGTTGHPVVFDSYRSNAAFGGQ